MGRASRIATLDGLISPPVPDGVGGLAGTSDEEHAIAWAVPPVRKRLRDGVRTGPRELEAIRSVDWSSVGLPLAGVPVLVLRGERNSSPADLRLEQVPGIAAGAG